jgi:rRNA-processing protein FCF1
MSNWQRSTQKAKSYETEYTRKMPEDATNRIRTVAIHYYWCNYSLKFFEKVKCIWKIRYNDKLFETVLIKANEVIFGGDAEI